MVDRCAYAYQAQVLGRCTPCRACKAPHGTLTWCSKLHPRSQRRSSKCKHKRTHTHTHTLSSNSNSNKGSGFRGTRESDGGETDTPGILTGAGYKNPYRFSFIPLRLCHKISLSCTHSLAVHVCLVTTCCRIIFMRVQTDSPMMTSSRCADRLV